MGRGAGGQACPAQPLLSVTARHQERLQPPVGSPGRRAPSQLHRCGNLLGSALATGLFLGLVPSSPVSPFSSPSPRTGPSQRVEGVQLRGRGQGVLGGEDTEAQGRREGHTGDEPACTSVLWVQGPRVGEPCPRAGRQLRVSLFSGGMGGTEAPSPGGRGPALEPGGQGPHRPPPWRDW